MLGKTAAVNIQRHIVLYSGRARYTLILVPERRYTCLESTAGRITCPACKTLEYDLASLVESHPQMDSPMSQDLKEHS
jgi:hypothetical protein